MNATYNIGETILAIEKDLASGLPKSLLRAQGLAKMLRPAVAQLKGESTPEKMAAAVTILTACGHTERALGKLGEAEVTYGEALTLLEQCHEEVRDRRAANLWTCQGLALLSTDSEESWKKAIQSFDRAIEMRERGATGEASSDWGLSAAWMNRADALGKLGGEPNLREALASLESATEVLSRLDLDANPGFRSRAALAWMERGNLLGRLSLDYSAHREADSLAAYDQAVEVLRPSALLDIPEPKRMLAVALSNRSRARAQLEGTEGLPIAEKDALESLSLIREEELEDPEMIRLMLTTRITLCHIVDGSSAESDRHSELTDIAEEGLQQVHPYAGSFHGELDELLGQLFRRGASAYFSHLPAFLSDYLLDFLDPEKETASCAFSPACHEAAVQVLWAGIAEWQERGFGAGEEREKRLEQIYEWQQCRERLAAIRSRHLSTEEKGGRS